MGTLCPMGPEARGTLHSGSMEVPLNSGAWPTHKLCGPTDWVVTGRAQAVAFVLDVTTHAAAPA